MQRMVMGAWLALLAMGCEPAAETGSGTTGQGACAATATICDPNDSSRALRVDACGNVLAVTKTCTSAQVCSDRDPDDPDRYITPRCIDKCGQAQFRMVCDDSDPTQRFWVNECGELSGGKSQCTGGGICVPGDTDTADATCRCPPTDAKRCFLDGNVSQYQPSYITHVSACSGDFSNLLDEDFLVAQCGFGEYCFQEDEYNGGEPECARSITNEGSLYYDYGCTFPMFVRTKTGLNADCRCRVTGDGHLPGDGNGSVLPVSGTDPGNSIAGCLPIEQTAKRREDLAGEDSMGSGPSSYDHCKLAGIDNWYSGPFDSGTRELYAPVLWTNQDHSNTTTIFAFQVDTGARRVVSGIYLDKFQGEVPYGSGYLSETLNADPQPLTGHMALRQGSDGQLYSVGVGWTGQGESSSAEIVRIDPQTGERTLVWLSQTDARGDLTGQYGQCLKHVPVQGFLESVAIQSRAFAMGPNDEFYLSFHSPNDGDGLLEIAPDGSTCRIVSRWGAEEVKVGLDIVYPAPDDIGTGLTPQYGPLYGMLERNGYVYLKTIWGDVLKVDLTTGNRIGVSSKADASDGKPGETTFFWDDTRDLLFTIGGDARYEGSVIDEKTNRIDSFFYDHLSKSQALLHSEYGPRQDIDSIANALANSNVLRFGAFAMDPQDNDRFYGVIAGGGLLMLERSTFNSFIYSL